MFITDMFKVRGASENWETLSVDVKERVVSQVADYLMEMFAGSLYLSSTSESNVVVGPIISTPIISTPFYRALDGFVRVPDVDAVWYTSELSLFRGPFANTTGYL